MIMNKTHKTGKTKNGTNLGCARAIVSDTVNLWQTFLSTVQSLLQLKVMCSHVRNRHL